MTDKQTKRPVSADELVDGAPLITEELLDGLMTRVEEEGGDLLGPDGLLNQVTKAVLERALDEELSDHLGYEKGDPAGRGSGNSRNGITPKRLHTEIGTIDLDVPRDRNGDFEPRIVPKGTSRLSGFNERNHRLVCPRGDSPGHQNPPRRDLRGGREPRSHLQGH